MLAFEHTIGVAGFRPSATVIGLKPMVTSSAERLDLARPNRRRRSRSGRDRPPPSAECAENDRAEWNVAVALKAPHLGLLDQLEIGGARVERDTRDQHR